MSKMHRFSLIGLQWSTGVVLIIESARFAFGSGAAKIMAHLGMPPWVRPALGICEMVAAILFLLPPAMAFGGGALLVIFVFAALIHLLHGQYEIGWLVIYAMAVLVILTSRNTKSARKSA